MSHPSIDALQKALSEDVFAHTTDQKKAAGRALGTILELISFYFIKAWGLQDALTIERRIPEYGNDKITHNVEFALHPIISTYLLQIDIGNLPVTTSKVLRSCGPSLRTALNQIKKDKNILSNTSIKRNCAIIAVDDDKIFVANLSDVNTITISELRRSPYAMIECKRVGVEEGVKKGPTTIEKAKQGAYVAKSLSRLQKIRGYDGTLLGVLPLPDGTYEINEYQNELDSIVANADFKKLEGLIISIGIVSDHGNWFTEQELNKELLVLKSSYDWLLFLSDQAMAQFLTDLIITPIDRYAKVSSAFKESYAPGKKQNRFTKVTIDHVADELLTKYFQENLSNIEQFWFTVLQPEGRTIIDLRDTLISLYTKSGGR